MASITGDLGDSDSRRYGGIVSALRTVMDWLPDEEMGKKVNHLDLLGKTVVLDVEEVHGEWEIPGRFLCARPTEVWLDGTAHIMDALVELALCQLAEHWQPGKPPVDRALVHIEVTDRLRSALRLRTLGYRHGEEKENQFALPFLQYLLVVADVPEAERVRIFGQGWDRYLHPCGIPVYYIDEFPFHRWSEQDPSNPLLRVLAIVPIIKEGGDPELTVRVVARALLEWDGVRWKLFHLLYSIGKRNGVVDMVRRIAGEEAKRKMEIDVNYTQEQAQEDIGPSLDSFTASYIQRRHVEPAVRKAKREATREATREVKQLLQQKEQEWRSDKHRLLVACLLEALRGNSIRLLPWQKTALRELPCESLPSIMVARKAKDAADFARRAGLRRKPNGGGNGKG